MEVVQTRSKDDYTVSDWLDIHGLEISTVGAVVANIQLKKRPRINASGPRFPYITAEEVWSLSSQALASFLPDQSDNTSFVSQFSERNFSASSSELPVTIDRGPGQTPLVSMCYQGAPADILCVAHEFGHALQYHLAKGRFVPPVLRELAAFCAEKIFLDFIKENRTELYNPLQAAWQRDNEIYLGNDAAHLNDTLSVSTAPYIYRMNYPLARHLADETFEVLPKIKLSEIFRGTLSLEGCLSKAISQIEATSMKNYLPKVPEAEKDRPAISAYRSLGIMALLDIDYWQGESEKSIEEYYSTGLGHMQTQTVLVAIDGERKPIGYATWEVDQSDVNIIHLKRQSAPFGDHLELHKKLQAWLPKNAKVLSHHTRSAREEQVAW